jgi:hypothetical protein
MIPRHPFDHLPEGRVRSYAVLLFLAWAALTGILLWAAPRSGAVELAFAGTPDEAARVVSALSDRDRISFSFMLGFDLLYDLVHNNAVALACIWASRRFRRYVRNLTLLLGVLYALSALAFAARRRTRGGATNAHT